MPSGEVAAQQFPYYDDEPAARLGTGLSGAHMTKLEHLTDGFI